MPFLCLKLKIKKKKNRTKNAKKKTEKIKLLFLIKIKEKLWKKKHLNPTQLHSLFIWYLFYISGNNNAVLCTMMHNFKKKNIINNNSSHTVKQTLTHTNIINRDNFCCCLIVCNSETFRFNVIFFIIFWLKMKWKIISKKKHRI